MDYNNLNERINRTLNSIQSIREKDITNNTNLIFSQNGKAVSTTITFGKKDIETMTNQIISIINNLSSFKDHLTNALIVKGETEINSKNIVKMEITQSLHLGVLLDIWNMDKHGSPLIRPYSTHCPIIKNIREVTECIAETNSPASLMTYPNGTVNSTGNIHTVIDADILDGNTNQYLFDIDDLTKESLSKWESLIKTYDLDN